MKKYIGALVIVFLFQQSIAQELDFVEENIKVNEAIEGTLTQPSNRNAKSLLIFIQGSGPTDRDGNQPMMKNDGMKKISRQLAEENIASYRFDKRVFKMNQLKLKEKDLRFSDFVKDVQDIVSYFENSNQYKNIILAGHSEGSLVGILAAQNNADGFISLAGVADPIDDIIVEQIHKQAPPLAEMARDSFDKLRQNGKVEDYNPMLENIFRADVQPYMNSWMQYNPADELKKLEIPILIISGTADIQVETEQAELLKEAKPGSKLVLLEGMNHIFRKVDSKDPLVNTKTYNEPNLPLHPELIPAISSFVNDL